MAGGRWQASLAFALTGEEFACPEPGQPDARALVDALASAGWDAGRIGDHARQRAAAGEAWPHQVPTPLRQHCGAAQLAASLGEARELLGLTTLEARGPSAPRPLTPDEQRLLREVPPHHVG